MFKIELWGPGACFTRPEMKVERVSYEVPTPSGIRGALDAIYWHPGMIWIIDRIYVLNPIVFDSIRRNEVDSRVSSTEVENVMNGSQKKLELITSDHRQQRAMVYLKNVHYVVEAHFEVAENRHDSASKFAAIISRRLAAGSCFSTPYLGVREFAASFREWPKTEKIPAQDINKDLGFMLYDIDFDNDNAPKFFKAELVHGCLDLTKVEIFR